MSEPFKPGDVVQDKRRIRVIERIQPHRIGAFIHFTDGTWTGEGSVELVEPSVPVSKIREVCEGMMLQTVRNDHENGWDAALEMVMAHLIDED